MKVCKLRAIRPLCVHGERIEAGVEFQLAPLEAANCRAGGRAEFVSAADAAAAQAAVRAHNETIERESRRRVSYLRHVEEPWRRVA